MQRSYERFSSEMLDAASAPVRLHVLKLLVSKGPLPYTEIMYEAKLDPVRDAGKFVYHLKTLRKAGLVSIEKGTKKYGITELGKILVEFSRDLEEYVAVKRGRLFVRTSRMTIEEFDRTRIAKSLVTEAGMPQSLADEIAAEAEERLVKFGTTYLSAPLIRELVNTILIERKLEEYRHKLTRLGLPVNDVTLLLREASNKRLDVSWVQDSSGAAVAGEYALLSSLPRPLVDAHLSGQIHLQESDAWVLEPSIVFHDIRPFLENGTPGVSPPWSFEAALETVTKIARAGERVVSGEQVFDHLNLFLAPFSKEIPRLRIQEAIKLFLYSLNWDGFSNVLPSQISITLDTGLPAKLANAPAIGMDGKIVGTYGDYPRETEELFRTILDAALEISKQIPVVNPSITVRVARDGLEKSDRLLNLAFEASARSAIPNFLVENTQPLSASAEGCMFVNGLDNVPDAKTIIGTVQVNLPRASYEAGGKEERLLQLVHSATLEAVKAIELRHEAVQQRVKEGLLPVFTWQTKGRSYSDLKSSNGEIALLGLAQAVKHHTHSQIWEKTNLGLAKKIVETAKQAIVESESRQVKFQVGFHASQEASTRLALIDAEKFGFSTIVFEGSKKYPYYTDVPGIPLTEKLPFAVRASLEGQLQNILDGGAILPVPVRANISPEGLAAASRQLSSAGNRYFTYSLFLSRCQRCYATTPGVIARCAKCGSENLTILAKSAGRLLPIDTWPEARRRDLDKIALYDFS